jgi:hypothetical protein
MADRAVVQVVAGDDEVEVPATPASQVQQSAADAPEAQPPVVEQPPQEQVADLGGNALQQPSPEQIVEAAGGSMADKMRARYNAISATEEFPVPGWELPRGNRGRLGSEARRDDRREGDEGR